MGPFEEVFPEFTTRGEDYTKVALIGITILGESCQPTLIELEGQTSESPCKHTSLSTELVVLEIALI